MENLLLVVAVCLDAFFACIAYGINKIKIPFFSKLLLTLMGTGFLLTSILTRRIISTFVREDIIALIGFSFLLTMGMISIFKSILKNIFKNNATITFSLTNINFALHVYLDEINADMDFSKSLSVKETIFLGAALSADSLITGFSINSSNGIIVMIILFSLFLGFISITLGIKIGNKISSNPSLNFSWVSGIILIIIGFMKLIIK